MNLERGKLPAIYAITDRRISGIDDHSEIARRLFAVGIRLLQVREKELPDGELLEAVESVVVLGRSCGATVLVNDRTDIARVAGTGVHLGETDLPAVEARRILPADARIGVSTHDASGARRAFGEAVADYVAFGPIFSSSTKTERAPRGIPQLCEVALVRNRPLVAIGGITSENVDSVLDAGADCAAVVEGLLRGGELERNARDLLDHVRRRERPGRVYLVGFSGSGKTSIGRRVAQRLRIPFVDLDAEIERTSGVTIREIFQTSGEEAFRQRETIFLEATESLPDVLVATGGGCFIGEENRRSIARLGRAVFLQLPFETILSRLSGKTDRPLFQSPEQAARLHAQREPFYRMAPLHVQLAGRTVEESADEVLNALFGGSGMVPAPGGLRG